MITELKVQQFALMEDVHLEFEHGMTVFTGETGAGKSLLVDALGAIFGARAGTDWVRHGAARAELHAVIESNDGRLQDLLQEQGVDHDEPLFLRRVIHANGRSRAWLNGLPTPLKILQKIGMLCLDLHGQHEHQGLMQASFQQQLVDSRVDTALLKAVVTALDDLGKLQKQLQNMQKQHEKNTSQASWMRFELDKLRALNIRQDLEEELAAQTEAGQHTAQIQQAGAQALMLLDEGHETNVRELLAQVNHTIEPLTPFHSGLASAFHLLVQMDTLLSEISPHLQDAQEVTLNTTDLQNSENRLADLREAMRRHGQDEVGLLKQINDWEQCLSLLDTAEWDETALQSCIEEAERTYHQQAEVLSTARQKSIDAWLIALRPYLDRLGMAGMRVNIELVSKKEDVSSWRSHGWDSINFILSSNPGEPFRALAQVASGGELSRLVLALKACGSFKHAPNIAVFDEVDVGIGGETAWCVGELLSVMGKDRQVFVVSHLPQVAACAQHQINILKRQNDGRTMTDLTTLKNKERVAEIARMLGGSDVESLKHAKQMLRKGGNIQ